VNAAGRTADVKCLAGVLLEVHALDADPEGARTILRVDLDIEPAIGTERLVVLRDLVVLRHVGIEVVLSRKPAPLRDRTVEGQADLDR
jgi:hypothetical protein